MIQSNMHSSKTMVEESEQAINFLAKIGNLLKQKRRYFDEAVVTHCIRLIKDHMDGTKSEYPTDSGLGVDVNEQKF